MKIEQFVMAYGVEHDKLRSILPEGFVSLRPVLRINAEVRGDSDGYVEFNTAVEKDGKRGWINIGHWNGVDFCKEGKTVTFKTDNLEISFTGAGIEGGCPAEKDNDGCYFGDEFRPHELITVKKEFCDCSFRWSFSGQGACGNSIGKTLPAVPQEVRHVYPKEAFTVENAAKISCDQVLGAYCVIFERCSVADGQNAADVSSGKTNRKELLKTEMVDDVIGQSKKKIVRGV